MSIWLSLEKATKNSVMPLSDVIDSIPWNTDGLITAIAQQYDTKDVLMLAWINKQALMETLTTQQVCYWSRSRKALWRKGETSGHTQTLIEARLDCDGDALLLLVDQQGPACHTGRPNCFYNAINEHQLKVICSKPTLLSQEN